MKIFTKKNGEGTKTAKFVGAYVPTNLYEYLSLYVIVNGTSKTELLNSLITEWFEDVSKTQSSKKDLIKDLVNFVLIPKWKEAKKQRIRIDTFTTQMRVELNKLGFDTTLIDQLIKAFKHDTK